MVSDRSTSGCDSRPQGGADYSRTPCLGFCTTALGDDVCKSCGRTFEEIAGWITMGTAEKSAVWARLKRDGFLEKQRIRLKKS